MTPLLLHDLLAALESVYQYGEDTLSGRADGGLDDRAWQRAAVIEMTRRARIALDGAKDFAGDERVGLFSTQRLLLHDLLYALARVETIIGEQSDRKWAAKLIFEFFQGAKK